MNWGTFPTNVIAKVTQYKSVLPTIKAVKCLKTMVLANKPLDVFATPDQTGKRHCAWFVRMNSGMEHTVHNDCEFSVCVSRGRE